MIQIRGNRHVLINARIFYVFDRAFGPILTTVQLISIESTVIRKAVNNSPWLTCFWTHPSPDRLPLPPQTVDLWWGWLDPGAETRSTADFLDPDSLQEAYQILSSEEQQRADRLDPSHNRSRFIQGRAQLRRILSGYLGQAAEAIALSQRGKPSLIGGGLQFNLSHCQNRVIYAMSHQAIGIDLEQVNRPIRSPLGLAQRFLGSGEIAAIAACDPDRQREGFLKHWVCKEAAIKAQGQGLAHQLGVDHSQLEPEPRLTIGAPWTLITLQPDLNHWAAIVHEGPIAELRAYRLDQNGMI
jgi:4'-phosphopantetheinyl transferase